MTEFRTLIPSYLDKDYRQSLRYELCEIVYKDYKGTTFFLDQMLRQKERVLKKLNDFVSTHPELQNYKGDSAYWYPFPNVDTTWSLNLNICNNFYPNKDGEITHFCQESERKNSFDHNDYLFDPLKIQFLLMSVDLGQMHVDNETARGVVEVNNKIFKLLLSMVGDTVNYSGENTATQIKNYLARHQTQISEIENNKQYSQDMKDIMLRRMYLFTENSAYLQDALVMIEKENLEQEITPQEISSENLNHNTKKI